MRQGTARRRIERAGAPAAGRDMRNVKRRPRGKPFASGNQHGAAHRFLPGQSGNPGGRPRTLSDAYRTWLAALDPKSGRTNAERIAEAVGRAALRGDTGAARELRMATEGVRVCDWRDELHGLVLAGVVTIEDVRAELGGDLAAELFGAALRASEQALPGERVEQ